MFNKILLTWLLISGYCFAANDFHVADLSRILAKNPEWKEFSRSVVFIRDDKSGGQGSGIFVSPVHILTADHVTASMECGALKIRTLMRAGNEPQIKGGRLLQCAEKLIEDKDLDIALLEVERSVRDYVKIDLEKLAKIKVAKETISLGYTTTAHFGFSSNCFLKALSGPSIRENRNTKSFANFLLTDCMVSPGMSGGPFMVKDDDGKWQLAGINSAILMPKAGNAHAFKVVMANIARAVKKHSAKFQDVWDMYP